LIDAGHVTALAEFLNRMRFAMRVEVADVSDEYVALATFGGGSALPALNELNLAVASWRDPWSAVTPGGTQYASGEHAGADWAAMQLVFKRSDLLAVIALVETGQVRAAGVMALDALEV